jgi:hypothetical protein
MMRNVDVDTAKEFSVSTIVTAVLLLLPIL